MGERLLCKQEVVGSIPSASMACALAWPVLWGVGWGGWACRHGREGKVRAAWGCVTAVGRGWARAARWVCVLCGL